MLHAFRFVRTILAYFVKTSLRTRGLPLMEKRKFLAAQVHLDAQKLLRELGFEVTVFGSAENVDPQKTYLSVGNHMSYMDPFILVSAHPSLFVTSVDMRETPVLGQICEIAGCIFVERRNRTTIEKDIAEMTNSLKAGVNVTIYPEGRATDGRDVYPFKKSLLMSAVSAGVDILPVVIKYTEIDGRPLTVESLDEVAWHGDMTFGPHFLHLMKAKSVKVELHFLPPIKTTPNSHRGQLADQARAAIRECYFADRRV